ncbi:sporulation integral membrane protein YtvI [Papillibacter cinnamivorans]|uniref:Sporulation integral membrane protein YtvI n=1 Tax=Papillibacter cinnamivorans DSM 12816 TaxID=1122930 RepID=A0A1W1ZDJ0_9FIRM|nr:sporulation integral membrane protein YtvI [Papillibacter cinnamivorans]SMC46302.1 sporulation integral membrane protein YtvI [Papillibacter cinnamivorans DSM 12816]
MTTDRKKKFIIDALFVAIILVIFYVTMEYLLSWLAPFIVGLILAVMLQKPINWICGRTSARRGIVAPLVTLVAVVVIVLALGFLTYSAINETISFVRTLPGWFQNTAPSVAGALKAQMEGILNNMPVEWESQISQITNDLLSSIQNALTDLSANAVGFVANGATKLPGLLLSFIIFIVATFFISVEFDSIKRFFKRQIPEKYRSVASRIWYSSGLTLVKMLQGYALIMLITYGELAIGLTLLGVDYSVIIAAVVAVVDILPVVGTGTILIPWAIIYLIIGQFSHGIAILLLYVTITVVRNIIEPRIIGARIGLHPLVTLICMYLGLHLFGFPGMILLPLIVILLKNMQDEGVFKIWKD